MTLQLRPYQEQAVESIRSTLRTMRPPRNAILQAETGSGKTVCATELIRRCWLLGRRAIFIARGRELVHQCCRQLDEAGVPYGVLMRGRGWNRERVQVASKDTLHSWCVRRKVMEPPPADLVILDECHLSMAKTWRVLFEVYAGAVFVGLTATPARGDGRGLGAVWKGMVQAIPTSKLIGMGFLVPTRVFAPYRPDLKKLKRDHNGDYDRHDAAERMDRPVLVGNVVEHWKELGEGRQTVVYGCTVAHALHLCEEFRKAGVRAAHVDGATETDLRDEIMGQIADGVLQVVTNVGVLQQGVDIPALSCAVLARPTRSLVLFRQICGRIKRPHPGKKDCVLIDHSGSVYHSWIGMPDEDIDWTLDEDEKIEERRERMRSPDAPLPVHCPNCHAFFLRGPQCPECGHLVRKQARPKASASGKLVEVDGGKPAKVVDRNRYWNYCLAVMAHRGRSAAAAGMMYKAKFGDWPGEGQSAALTNLPCHGQWKVSVAVLFPQFLQPRARP